MGAEQSTPVPEEEALSAPGREEQVTSEEGTQPRSSALVICGPSGVGKGTLVKKLMEGSDQYGFSVSHTTRKPRQGEKDGVHYFFTTKEDFSREVGEGKFLEYAEVHGNLYGTSVAAVQRVLDQGKVCVLDIDVQGARQVAASSIPALFAFVAPPSHEELERRLRGRGTETEEQVARRLAAAQGEIDALKQQGLFQYVIVNDDLEEAARKLAAVGARAAAGLPAEVAPLPEGVLALLQDPTSSEDPEPAPPAAAAPAVEESAAPAPAAPGVAAAAHIALTTARTKPAIEPVAPALGSAAAAAAGMERWRGKVALVTGASAGIGWAVCEALGRVGVRVLAVARRRERLEALQRHLVSPAVGMAPTDLLPVVCDVTKEAEVAALTKILTKRWPDAGIDILVACAGLSRGDASIMSGSTSSWVEMVSTNVLGSAMCMREVVQDMKRRGSYGHVIVLTGLSSHRIPDGPQGGGFYCGTKAALRAMTEGLRQEARGAGVPLRVSAISPGVVDTEFFSVRAFGDSVAAEKALASAAGRAPLSPADVAGAVVWALAAPDHVEVNDVVLRPREQLV